MLAIPCFEASRPRKERRRSDRSRSIRPKNIPSRSPLAGGAAVLVGAGLCHRHHLSAKTKVSWFRRLSPLVPRGRWGAGHSHYCRRSMFNPRLTTLIEGECVSVMELEKQTAKGLHFSKRGHLCADQAVRRRGPVRARAFAGTGRDQGVSLAQGGLRGDQGDSFKSGGIFLPQVAARLSVHIARGDVKIQTYEPKPDNKPPKPPVTSIFLPDPARKPEAWCAITRTSVEVSREEPDLRTPRW